MNTLFFVVCIVAIACTASTVQQYMKLREGRKNENSDLQDTLAKLGEIEKRMQVLERIVTEKKFDLKAEIDKL